MTHYQLATRDSAAIGVLSPDAIAKACNMSYERDPPWT